MQFHRRPSTDVSIDCSVNETNNRGERKILQWPRLQQFQTRKNRKGKLREVPSGAALRAASNGEDSLRTVPPYMALLRFSIFLSRVYFFIVPTRHGQPSYKIRRFIRCALCRKRVKRNRNGVTKTIVAWHQQRRNSQRVNFTRVF